MVKLLRTVIFACLLLTLDARLTLSNIEARVDDYLSQGLTSGHPRLQALPIEERYKDYYRKIELGYAWIAGFRPFLFWENTTECFDRWTNATFIERPAYNTKYAEAADLGDRFAKINLTTALISNYSVHGWYCNDMLTTASEYWNATYHEYD